MNAYVIQLWWSQKEMVLTLWFEPAVDEKWSVEKSELAVLSVVERELVA